MDLKNLGLRLAAIGDVLAHMDGDANLGIGSKSIEGQRIDRLSVALTVSLSHPSNLRMTIFGDGAEMDIDCGDDGVVHMFADYGSAKGNEAWRTVCQRLRDDAKK